jgi:hypothetical protein
VAESFWFFHLTAVAWWHGGGASPTPLPTPRQGGWLSLPPAGLLERRCSPRPPQPPAPAQTEVLHGGRMHNTPALPSHVSAFNGQWLGYWQEPTCKTYRQGGASAQR